MIKQRKDLTIRVDLTDFKKVIHRYLKMTKRRFKSICRGRKYKKFDVFVDYGLHKDNFGKMSRFGNSGTYYNFRDALAMLSAFLEVKI